MRVLTKWIISFLSLIFPKLRKIQKEENLKQYTFKKVSRNIKCYCKSGRKYKHCHLKENRKNGVVALLATDKNQNSKMKLVDKKTAYYLIYGYQENKSGKTSDITDQAMLAIWDDHINQIDI